MLETTEIEHADTAVGAAGDEDVDAVGAEADIEDFFVVGDELGLCGEGWDIPDGAGGVNGRGDDEGWRDGIPIERGQRSCVFWCLRIRQKGKRRELIRWRRLMICAPCDIVGGIGYWRGCWQRP